MHKRPPIARGLALCGALLAAASPAQERTGDQLYHVEIVVFEHIDGSRAEEDFFHGIDNPRHLPPPQRLPLPRLEVESLVGFVPRSDRVLPDTPPPATEPAQVEAPPPPPAPAELPQDALELFELSGAGASSPIRFAGPLPPQFRVLGADELELGDVRADIYRRREYRVLGHAGWVQPGLAASRTVPVDLRLLGIDNPSGTISVYLENYLHVAVDLEFADGRGTYWTAYPSGSPEPLEYAPRYRLDFEPERTISRGELVYIDHPLFGILVRIIRAPDPVEPDAEPAPGGPAA